MFVHNVVFGVECMYYASDVYISHFVFESEFEFRNPSLVSTIEPLNQLNLIASSMGLRGKERNYRCCRC